MSGSLHLSQRGQLIATAIGASLLTAALLNIYNAHTRRTKRKQLDQDILRSLEAHDSLQILEHSSSKSSRVEQSLEYDENLVREQLARNYAFFGEEGMKNVRRGKVVVVGCGGVGSWAAVMLVRSGVSKIRLVDFDYVSLSSLNRHATATIADVGTPKVKCIEKTLRQIAKWVDVETHIDVWRKEGGRRLLEGADWVIDAIDNIQTKVELLVYCHENNIRVFSSMGSGAKSDPTRIQIADISDTVYDPLARSVRRQLRVLGIKSGIPVVYSTEVPGDVKLLPLPEEEFQKGSVNELGVFDDFRVRILPVLGPLPAIFGLNIATYVICDLARKPIANPLPIKHRRKLYEKLYRGLLDHERKIAGYQINRLPINEDDISFIFEDLHRGRSIVPPHDINRPTLVRWDPRLPLSLENCVVFESKEAERHIRECWDTTGLPKQNVNPDKVWGEEVTSIVERRRLEAAKVKKWIL